jgi:hypothetical protein
MAGRPKTIITESNDTVFNVKEVHVDRIKKLIDGGYETVIIHGDGSLFAGKDALEGSNHHKEFNSGVPTVNVNEPIAKNAYRAFYKKGETLPESPQDIIKEFYNNQNKDLQKSNQPEQTTGFNGAITV